MSIFKTEFVEESSHKQHSCEFYHIFKKEVTLILFNLLQKINRKKHFPTCVIDVSMPLISKQNCYQKKIID